MMMSMKASLFFLLAIIALGDVLHTVQALKTGVYTISNQGVPKSCTKKGSYMNSNKCKSKKMPFSLSSDDSNTWEINFDKATGLASIKAACGKDRGAHLSAEIINCDGKVRFLDSAPRFVWLVKKAKQGLYTIEFSNHWANYDGACNDVFLGIAGSGCGSLGVSTPSGSKTLWKIEKPKIEKPKPKPKPKKKPKKKTPPTIPPPPAPTCTDGIKNGSETDVDCGGSCPTKCADTKACLVPIDCESKECDSSKKCAPLPPMLQGSYQKSSDGQCWYMVLQYWHKGGADPLLIITEPTQVPPVLSSTLTLGDDGSLVAGTWGHLGNAAMTELNVLMPYSKLRFYCKSSLHSRVVHFESSSADALTYFRTGTGGAANILYTLFADNTSTDVPADIPSTYPNQGDKAMTMFPFYKAGNGHWSIGAAGRWECDDYANNASSSTLHQVYVDAPSYKCA